MLAKHNSLNDLFINIANVVKHNAGAMNDSIIADDFPTKIRNIQNNVYDVRIKKLIERTMSTITPYSLEGITSIGNSAFAACSNLALTSLPEGITSIGGYAFDSCSNLKSIIFKGTPSSISSTAFSRCNNLTTINVPWSEGAVANAPWGATNATINYNYTGE